MRLLKVGDDGELSLVEFVGSNIPRYAILSHTWGSDDQEVTLKDLTESPDRGKTKAGYEKIRFCTSEAAKNGLPFSWVDTCCIDKLSSSDLTESINSMFRWYRDAAKCFVFLSDVSNSGSADWKSAWRHSRWFTRGWTLQELVAPAKLEFFSAEGASIGIKDSMVQEIHEITGISTEALQGRPLSQFSIDERLSWAARRETKREEDSAYSLLGIFDIHMPLIYGEGRTKAFNRLRREIQTSLTELRVVINVPSLSLTPAGSKMSDIKSWIDPPEYKREFEKAQMIRMPDTGDYILNDPVYKSWKSETSTKYGLGLDIVTSEVPPVLFIKGKMTLPRIA
ncbi:HET-domain-containing protein [Lophium mytilinum]|uniref:HET-domain-containing protein n=1 Tax=Lophium mytilinum TaxID=390894 RepID=A0A6A6QSV6_9PEZI|nr:HET-domain-containing protein [Lophium mytilinum]